MSEEKVETTMEEQTDVPAEVQETKEDIASELQNLGRNLAAATKAVLESPEAQEFRAQLQKGMESLEKSVNKMVSQTRETEVGKKVESGVSEAATTVKERGVLDTLTGSVLTALQTVNQSLAQAVEKAEVRAQEKKAAPQQIEIAAEEETEAKESEE